MSQTKAQRQRQRQRDRIRAEVMAELGQSLRTEIRAEVEAEVCRERNTAFGHKPVKDHEFIPVRDSKNHLDERCCVCGQRRDAVLPHDQRERLRYVERVVDEQVFKSRYQAISRQHTSESPLDPMSVSGWLGATGPHGATGASGSPVFAGPPGSTPQQMSHIGQLLAATVPQVNALSVSGKSMSDAMKAVNDAVAVNGQKPTMLIVDELSMKSLTEEAAKRIGMVRSPIPPDALDQIMGIPVICADVSSIFKAPATD